MRKAKSFEVSKLRVMEAWELVKKRKGSAGIDGLEIEDIEKDYKSHLYKLWNRMSSGCYFPPAVMQVEIPKKDGGKRTLGIPTVLDRVAQMVVKLELEPRIDPLFHEDSYGYRPGKSAHDAVAKVQERCYQNGWVVDLDISGFFDNLDHELMMKAIRWHKVDPWIELYVKRWLQVPLECSDGFSIERTKGTPQGGVISPLLANLYLHYAFDMWIKREYPYCPFERYADDIIIHCKSQRHAQFTLARVKERLSECGLTVHPQKTKIVFCKRSKRKGDYPVTSFDFLGFTFRPRVVKSRDGNRFLGFLPAISNKSRKAIHDEIRGWQIQLWSSCGLEYISSKVNSKLRGWFQYYGRFRKSSLYRTFAFFNNVLAKWAKRKFKRLNGSLRKCRRMIWKIAKENPELFYHWKMGIIKTVG